VQLKHHIANFSLPLLAKELIEQAARRRTYIIRVVYAVILFLATSLFFYQTLSFANDSPLAVLGHGKDMFGWLVGIQFAGIYFFMPAMTVGVITQEKERASLQLLFLTRLGPWTILFEKLMSRLVPMACFVLLSLPLLGIAYTLGGVSRDMLWRGAWMLFLAALQMGTLALACSAYFRTTVAAFMASYVLAFLMIFGPYMCAMLVLTVGWMLDIHFEQIISRYASDSVMFLVFFPFFTPPHFFINLFGGGAGGWLTVLHSIVILGTSASFLLLARRFVFDRAFLPSRNPIWMSFLRRRKARQVERPAPVRQAMTADAAEPLPMALSAAAMREMAGSADDEQIDESLPGDEPVAWRETSKRFLGDARHLWLAVIITVVPLVFLGFILGMSSEAFMASMITGPMLFFMWLLAVLIISVKSASLIAGERTHQTLDVLCTSPMTGREIILQKFRGVRRLIMALWAPFLVVMLFGPWWVQRNSVRFGSYYVDRFSAPLYLFCAVLSIAVYFPLVAWLSLLIGLKLKTQIRAIIGSMAAIAIWCIMPLVFIVLPLAILAESTGRFSGGTKLWEEAIKLLSLLSPATIVFANEASGLHEYPGPWTSVWLNFAVYGTALIVIRRTCLRNADRWLGRTTGPSGGRSETETGRPSLSDRALPVIRRLTDPHSQSTEVGEDRG